MSASTAFALNALRAREILYRHVREFFASQNRVEVVDPALFLSDQAVFQISKQSRQDVIDRRHQTEFTVLEWRQSELTVDHILLHVDQLLQAIFTGEFEPERRSFRQAFIQRLGFDPDQQSAADLQQQARRLGLNAALGEDCLAWLKLMFVHFIEPTLGIDVPLYLTDLPNQWRDTQYDGCVRRHSNADIFIDGIKVGSVLTVILDESLEKPHSTMDQYVVLGLDRLLMIILETRRISQVMSVDEV